MSFLHPSGDTNSAGDNPDPLTPERIERADEANSLADRLRFTVDPLVDYFTTGIVEGDLLRLHPIDSLPQDQQDQVRRRREKAMKESRVPWIVHDAGALLGAIDAVDDLVKTGIFAKDYVVGPLARQLPRITGFPPRARDELMETWRNNCAKGVRPRQRKQAALVSAARNIMTFPLGLLFSLLFPQWRGISLAVQAAQTVYEFFGVGLQLGPLLGAFQETFFRAGELIGLPFGPEHNKWNQLNAAKVTSNAHKLAAAASSMHPEDTVTALAGIDMSGDRRLMSPVIIQPQDYPDLSAMISEPWQQVENFVDLAASLPYNMGAGLLNNFVGPTFDQWSYAVGGGGLPDLSTEDTENRIKYALKLLHRGTCPGGQCDAELYQILITIAQGDRRAIPAPEFPAPDLTLSTRLGLILDLIYPL